MARVPRSEYVHAGGTYHFWSRGSNRGDVYFAVDERREFLRRLGAEAERYGWSVLAYCLLTNHYHGVVHIPEGGLSEGLQRLHGGFSRWVNRQHGRTAHLWKNRFGCKPAHDDEQLLAACRYVVLNPVRAGLCRHPAEWPWSSYNACAWDRSLPEPPRWLDVERVLSACKPFDPADPRAAYRRFVRNGLLWGQTQKAAVSDMAS